MTGKNHSLAVCDDRRRSSDTYLDAARLPDMLSSIPISMHEWPSGKKQRIGEKDHLYREGEEKANLYKVLSGAVCLYRILADGRRQVIDFAFASDIIGFDSGGKKSCSAQALIDTDVSCFPITTLITAAKADSRIAMGLCEALSRELVVTREHLKCLGNRSAMEKVATFLIMLSRRNALRGLPSDIVNLPMSRADIGDFLGITLETVSRTLTRLKVQGLIDIEYVTTVHLLNFPKLTGLAEGRVRL